MKDVENIIINRYKLEKQNSFNRQVDQKFLAVWESIEELSDFLDSQLDFYENRIFKIKCELNKLSDGINIEESFFQLLFHQRLIQIFG